MTRFRLIALCSFAIAALLSAYPAHAQVAPIQYWLPNGPFGVGAQSADDMAGLVDEDGSRKGFSFRSFSVPASSFGGSLGLARFGAFGSAGLMSEGAQYGYSFKGIGDLPMTLFGSASALRTTPDVFTSLVTPGFERSNTLATSVSAGVAFNPTPNVSLSFSAGVVQPSAATDTDLRSQLLSSQQPAFRGLR